MPHIRIKMCGMTRQEDIDEAVDLGVNALGFIFYPPSLRFISAKQANLITRSLPPFVEVAAVFVNPETKWVQEVLDSVRVDIIQFHGVESAEFCRKFNLPYIKTISATNTILMDKEIKQHPQCSAFLFDTPSHQHGGTGKSFDWELIPKHLEKPCIVAGGLNPHNVSLIKPYKPYAVDVCSGVESRPGIKDHLKMSRFVTALWGKNETI